MVHTGSDLDTAVVRDELATIARVIALSRRARHIVIANLAIAAISIAVLVLRDLFKHLPLPLGVAGHEGSTVIVELNRMRVLSQRAWHRTRTTQRAPPVSRRGLRYSTNDEKRVG